MIEVEITGLPWLFALTAAGMIGLAACTGGSAGGPGAERADEYLLDDFGRDDNASVLGTRWRSFTDVVMGGVSTGAASRDQIDGRRCIRLRGRVSLENNGGFIQVALPLEHDGEPFDAGEFEGIRVAVRGNGEPGYYLHLRTADLVHPWEHFSAELPVSAGWTEVRIPFSDFVPMGTMQGLDSRRLLRLGIVAGKRAFEADVAVARVSFYRSPSRVAAVRPR